MHLNVERTLFFKMLCLTTDRKDRRNWLYDTSFLWLEAKGDPPFEESVRAEPFGHS